ncbi:MAG: protein kinase, partial [Waddliaceae bacterium]|nr:protein kinase [Waddliaceae bacterium]
MKKRIIGDYNIIKQIGQGALGTVCLAEHRFMKKQYALKVLPEELAADRAFIKRFEKEIKTLSTLDHPHIVKVHNVSSAKGTYFLVTDCVVDDMGETTNLAQYITTHEGPIAEDELVRMLKQVVGALDHIHTRTQGEGAMAHRGLKLNNVLVGKGKKGVDLFLSDCGLSNVIGSGAVLSRAYKALGDTLDVTVVETTKGGEEKYPSKPSDPENVQRLNNSFLQHLAFLAPEQRNTNGAVAAVSSDIYAFGVMTYYLITGEYPEGIFDMPSALRPEYRLPWDDFIKACMQKDPARRPTSLLGAFDDLLNQRHNNEDGFVTYTMKKPQPKTTEKIEEKELVAVGAIKAPAKQEKNKASEPKALLAEMSDLKPAIKEKALETPTYEEDPAATIRVDRSVTHYEPEPVKHIDIEPIMTDMVVIKGGKFFRGSNDGNRDEMPRHEVNIESIAVDIHPVTNEQFIRFLEAMGGEKDVNNNDTIQLRE